MPRLGVRIRPGFTIHPVLATWDFIVFEACSPARRAYACVPRASLPGFASRLEDGSLDMQTMISHRYPLAEVTSIFEDIASHRMAHQKIILFPEQ